MSFRKQDHRCLLASCKGQFRVLQSFPAQKLGCACKQMSVTDMAAWASIDC